MTEKRKIHYCWFGGNPKSETIVNCINSWRKYLPDREIIEWNETNFDLKISRYVAEAYSQKKWAFVADYCRLWVLYNFGGIYFDTDVEIIKEPHELFDENMMGFENNRTVNPGLVISCDKGNWFCKEMLDLYNGEHFITEKGYNFETICDRATKVLKKHGLKINNKTQDIDGIRIYSADYFNPLFPDPHKPNITEHTYLYHHFLASWVDAAARKNFKRNFNGKIYDLMSMIGMQNVANTIYKLKKRILQK